MLKFVPMKVAVQLLFTVLTVSLASLTPIVPGEIVAAAKQKTHCCADMNTAQRCPLNQGGNSSTSGSACCVSPSTCVPLHADSGDKFGAFAEAIGRILVNDDSVSTRFQRPPVPPPRGEFS